MMIQIAFCIFSLVFSFLGAIKHDLTYSIIGLGASLIALALNVNG